MTAEPHLVPPHGFPEALIHSVLDDALGSQKRTRVLAISGLQGSGKSTLATQLVHAARQRGLAAAQLSIDDVYLTRAQRRLLAAQVHPLLATRGPPGTHDVDLALRLMARIKAGATTQLPRFDKLADDRAPVSEWETIPAPLDLLVFEGWCLGVPAQPEHQLDAPINALEAEQDADGRWRHWCNHALATAYTPLWQTFDRLWFLQPPAFSIVAQWRWQQEQAMQAAAPHRNAMSQAQVERFVQFYERISRHALRMLPDHADRIIALDAQRQVLSY